MTPVLDRLVDIDDVSEATIQKKIAIARVAWAVKTGDLEGLLDASTTRLNEDRIQDSEGVEVHYLNEGEEPEVLSDDSPSSSYDPFMKLNRKDIAVGVQMPYEAVSGDRSESTYSSERSGKLESQEVYRVEQFIGESILLRPIYELVQEEGFLLGEWGQGISPAEFYGLQDEWLNHCWFHKGWDWVDPKNDAQATQVKLVNNLTSLSREYASMGLDWEEEIGQIALEKERLASLGLGMAEVTQQMAIAGGGQEDDENSDE